MTVRYEAHSLSIGLHLGLKEVPKHREEFNSNAACSVSKDSIGLSGLCFLWRQLLRPSLRRAGTSHRLRGSPPPPGSRPRKPLLGSPKREENADRLPQTYLAFGKERRDCRASWPLADE